MTRDVIDEKPASTIERLRLRLYTASFLIAFLLDLAVHARGRGDLFWLAALLLAGAIGAEWARLSASASHRTFPWLVIAAVALTTAVPLLSTAAAKGQSLPAAIAGTVVWPQILVALFGSRVLSEDSALRFAEFWRRPLAARGPVQLQSTPAAFALAVCMTLIFYLASPAAAGASSDPALAIISGAILGATAIHCAIIFLFFVILAHILEAAFLHARDRVLVNQIRAALCARAADSLLDPAAAVAAILKTAAASAAHTRGVRLMREALRAATDGLAHEALDSLSFEHFQNASRRFMRALLPLLPLLGFLGTIVGLSTTLMELPHALAAGGAGRALDFSGALAGLAIKFQTTLLGLLGSMVAGFCLAILERREAELAAECLLIGDSALGSTAHV